ncbi:site-specific recombinase XerD [Winogradskyella wandonensis]|uniref:Site-specific recombinase XerD n=1 Tax=Winogradskyella wandonensis TaxID=1442586 RepID=A0A4R1KRM8_9FLAO|nr:site-specific integrase [Winogradskyella wandonensis]TCK67237.1 site-specific recombinase XerD [Winogradskyella wandonensis]
MLNFKALIQREYKNAYESAYDLPLKKQFSNPKIYTAKGDLSKRWYVYFSFRDPRTNRLKMQTPYYGSANTYKTKEERMAVLTVYRQIILKYLKLGYNPYLDNTDMHFDKIGSIQKDISKETEHATDLKSIKSNDSDESQMMTLEEAFSFDMTFKKKSLRDSSLRSYSSHLKVFRVWLEKHYNDINGINRINKKIVIGFLNHILQKTSARNRNNYRASLSSFFQLLEDNDIIEVNFVKKIKVLKSVPKVNKRYSKEEQKAIFSYLKENDELLLLYVKFVAYNFLRPIEVCRLKVGDIDLKQRTVSFIAKNSPFKRKRIPDVLFEELPDLRQYDKDALLFTRYGIGQHWDSSLESRRGYFTKRFSKVVKRKFNLDLEHTLYSFRHTYITKLYRGFLKDFPPHVAKGKLMHITGHSSMSALEKYLRNVDAELPEDYSSMLID